MPPISQHQGSCTWSSSSSYMAAQQQSGRGSTRSVYVSLRRQQATGCTNGFSDTPAAMAVAVGQPVVVSTPAAARSSSLFLPSCPAGDSCVSTVLTVSCLFHLLQGKTDYRARLRLTTQDKNKYNTHKYRIVVSTVM